MTEKMSIYLECSIIKLQLYTTQLSMIERELESRRMLNIMKETITDKNVSKLLNEISVYTNINGKLLTELLTDRQEIIFKIKNVCNEIMELDPKYTYFISFFTEEELCKFSRLDDDMKKKYIKMKMDAELLKICRDYEEYNPNVKRKKYGNKNKKSIDIFRQK